MNREHTSSYPRVRTNHVKAVHIKAVHPGGKGLMVLVTIGIRVIEVRVNEVAL